MLSGYFTRKQPVDKYLKRQVDLIIKPYVVTACIAVFFTFFRNIFVYHITLQMVKETVKTALGFLLGVSPSGLRYFGLKFYNCGPMWFAIALMIGTTILLWTLNHVDEKKYLWLIAGAFIIFNLLFLIEEWIPFSLDRGLYAFVNLFLGYLMKKNKLLDKPLSKYHWLLGAICYLGMFACRMGYYENLLLQLVFCGFGGVYVAFLAIYIFCMLAENENWLSDKLEYIGQNSFVFFCVHTVENTSLPWWKICRLFHNQPVLGTVAIFALKVSICVAGSALVMNRKTLWKKIHKA